MKNDDISLTKPPLKRPFELYKSRFYTVDCMGNNPMVGATVACAVAVEEALKK